VEVENQASKAKTKLKKMRKK